MRSYTALWRLRHASWAGLIGLALQIAPASAGVVVIGNPALPRVDATTVQKIFLGKVIELGGIGLTAANARSGSPLRERFLSQYLEQDEEKYTSYWTVRRYIGKGAPPRELASSADIISFVQSTPGAIAYLDEADLKPGLNVLLKR